MMRHAFHPQRRLSAEPVMTPLALRVSRGVEIAVCAVAVAVAMLVIGLLMDVGEQCRTGGGPPGVPGSGGAILVVVLSVGLTVIGSAVANLFVGRLLFRVGGFRCGACGRTLAGRRDRCCFAALPQPPARSGVTR